MWECEKRTPAAAKKYGHLTNQSADLGFFY